jgi:hypothetical protein
VKKAYLLIYSNQFGTRDEVRDYINNSSSTIIDTWRFDIPNSFYIISEKSADALSKHFLSFSKEKGLFLITEITDNSQGWLPQRSWDLINEKKLPPKKE